MEFPFQRQLYTLHTLHGQAMCERERARTSFKYIYRHLMDVKRSNLETQVAIKT